MVPHTTFQSLLPTWSSTTYTSLNLSLWLWILGFRSDTHLCVTHQPDDLPHTKFRSRHRVQASELPLEAKPLDSETESLTQHVLKCPSTGWSLLALLTLPTAPALISTKDNTESHLLATAALHCIVSSDSFMSWSRWCCDNMKQPSSQTRKHSNVFAESLTNSTSPSKLKTHNSHWQAELHHGNTASGTLVL